MGDGGDRIHQPVDGVWRPFFRQLSDDAGLHFVGYVPGVGELLELLHRVCEWLLGGPGECLHRVGGQVESQSGRLHELGDEVVRATADVLALEDATVLDHSHQPVGANLAVDKAVHRQ